MRLNDIQAQFKDMILGSYDEALSNDPFNHLFEKDEIALNTRFHVYRDGVLENFVNVLKATYPTVHALVGDDFFRKIARLYARQFPPSQGCINLYGQNFPTYLTTIKQANHLPYLHDVAAYDWAYNTAFYAPDEDVLDISRLKDLNPQNLAQTQFIFLSSVCLIKSQYPLPELHGFCDPDKAENTQKDQSIDIDQGGGNFLIARPEFKVNAITLQDDVYDMIQALHDGQTVEAALEKTLMRHPHFEFESFLHMLLSADIVSGFKAP